MTQRLRPTMVEAEILNSCMAFLGFELADIVRGGPEVIEAVAISEREGLALFKVNPYSVEHNEMYTCLFLVRTRLVRTNLGHEADLLVDEKSIVWMKSYLTQPALNDGLEISDCR